MASFLARLVVVQRERELLNGPPAATIAGRRPGRVCVSTAVVMCVVATRGKIGWLGMSRGQWQVVESKGLGARAVVARIPRPSIATTTKCWRKQFSSLWW